MAFRRIPRRMTFYFHTQGGTDDSRHSFVACWFGGSCSYTRYRKKVWFQSIDPHTQENRSRLTCIYTIIDIQIVTITIDYDKLQSAAWTVVPDWPGAVFNEAQWCTVGWLKVSFKAVAMTGKGEMGLNSKRRIKLTHNSRNFQIRHLLLLNNIQIKFRIWNSN